MEQAMHRHFLQPASPIRLDFWACRDKAWLASSMLYPLWRPHPASLPLKEIEGLIGYIEPKQGTDNDQQSINVIRTLVLTPSDLANC